MYNNVKDAIHQSNKTQRHNRRIEETTLLTLRSQNGLGLYLKPYLKQLRIISNLGQKLTKINQKHRPTNIDLTEYSAGVLHFRGIHMQNSLPKTTRQIESAIIILDDKTSTH